MKIKINQFPDGFHPMFYISGLLAKPGFVFVDNGSWESQKEKVEEIMRPICKNKLNWPDLINRLIIEDDSDLSWLRTLRLDQFIAFMAHYAFFSLV